MSVRVGPIEPKHPPDVLGRQPGRPGKGRTQISGDDLDNGFAPTHDRLLLVNRLSNVPIEIDQIAIDMTRGRETRGGDPCLQIADKLPVSRGDDHV